MLVRQIRPKFSRNQGNFIVNVKSQFIWMYWKMMWRHLTNDITITSENDNSSCSFTVSQTEQNTNNGKTATHCQHGRWWWRMNGKSAAEKCACGKCCGNKSRRTYVADNQKREKKGEAFPHPWLKTFCTSNKKPQSSPHTVHFTTTVHRFYYCPKSQSARASEKLWSTSANLPLCIPSLCRVMLIIIIIQNL